MIERPEWWADAACRGIGPALFFGPPFGSTETVAARRKREHSAKAFCAVCTVAVDCLAEALKFSDDGIRGGLTRYERYQTAAQPVPARQWVVIATSALTGCSSLQRHADGTDERFRVVKGATIVHESSDESEAWIALHNSDL